MRDHIKSSLAVVDHLPPQSTSCNNVARILYLPKCAFEFSTVYKVKKRKKWCTHYSQPKIIIETISNNKWIKLCVKQMHRLTYVYTICRFYRPLSVISCRLRNRRAHMVHHLPLLSHFVVHPCTRRRDPIHTKRLEQKYKRCCVEWPIPALFIPKRNGEVWASERGR